jgi:hypothetical protein
MVSSNAAIVFLLPAVSQVPNRIAGPCPGDREPVNALCFQHYTTILIQKIRNDEKVQRACPTWDKQIFPSISIQLLSQFLRPNPYGCRPLS